MYKNLTTIEKDYAALAATYEKRWAGFLAPVRDWVMAHLPDNSPANIIDLGCGTGVMLQKLGTRFPETALTGIDASPAMLAIAKQNTPQADLKNGDLTTVTGQYDLVLSLNVLHHLPDADTHLKQLRNLCAADGSIFLCDFALDSLKMRIAELYWRGFHPAHYKAFSSAALQKAIKKNGLHITAQAVLKPDRFWRLQIYRLSRR